jgi:hypothetical protein
MLKGVKSGLWLLCMVGGFFAFLSWVQTIYLVVTDLLTGKRRKGV